MRQSRLSFLYSISRNLYCLNLYSPRYFLWLSYCLHVYELADIQGWTAPSSEDNTHNQHVRNEWLWTFPVKNDKLKKWQGKCKTKVQKRNKRESEMKEWMVSGVLWHDNKAQRQRRWLIVPSRRNLFNTRKRHRQISSRQFNILIEYFLNLATHHILVQRRFLKCNKLPTVA